MPSGLVPQQCLLVLLAPGSPHALLKQTPTAALSAADFGSHNVFSLSDLCVSPRPPLQGDKEALVPVAPGQPRCLLELRSWVPLQVSSGEESTAG